MINFLCEAGNAGDGVSRGIMTALLIVVLIGMLVMPYFSQKKKSKEYEEMINSLKAGDLVKTAGGIIGRINKIIDKGEIKTVVLETGSKTDKSYIEFDMNMIYCVLKSTKVENAETEDDLDEEDETEEAKASEETVKEVETEVTETTEETNVEETAKETEETADQVEETTEEETQEVKAEEQKKEEYKKTNAKVKVSANKKSNSKNNSKKK